MIFLLRSNIAIALMKTTNLSLVLTGIALLHGVSLCQPASAQTVEGLVVNVADGDTVQVTSAGKLLRIRLACIDAPEMGQKPYGKNAADYLSQLLPPNTRVTLQLVDTDRLNRSVALVYQGKRLINLAMVGAGQAVVYPKYLDRCPQQKTSLLQSEATAKQNRLGFWNQPNPLMPWNYRHSRGK
uniref:Nuclease (SNase domain protein) n=1 Tax=Cyanothece sp. (strain PCC 7425 / ATCC 29141) TaxID=395961 RepID=B8HVF4_CYAP4